MTAHNETPDSYELYKPFNFGSYVFGAEGGNVTDDKVFLLSWTEARDYLGGKLYDKSPGAENNNQKLLCRSTAYVQAQEVSSYPNSDNYYPANTVSGCSWWLRSPGNFQDYAARVDNSGALDYYNVFQFNEGVRPAILIH